MDFELKEQEDLMMSLLHELNMSFDFFDDYFKEKDAVKDGFGLVVSALPKPASAVNVHSKDISFCKVIMSLGLVYS